jgi:hypothetical protein
MEGVCFRRTPIAVDLDMAYSLEVEQGVIQTECPGVPVYLPGLESDRCVFDSWDKAGLTTFKANIPEPGTHIICHELKTKACVTKAP